jgi:hypothetical protein
MTGFYYIVCLAGVALSLGCQASQSDRGASGDTSERGAESMQPPVDGYYVYGHEVNTFTPCASDSTYWVVGDDRTPDSLRVTYFEWSAANQAEPYAPMFARFRGHVASDELDGFAEAYDGTFLVEEIVLLLGIEEDDCPPAAAP